MSLLMQALKKAEHAKKQHDGAPGTDATSDSNPPDSPSEGISLSPKEPDQFTAAESSPSNLDTLGLELSPLAASHTAEFRAEPLLEAQTFIAQESTPLRPTHTFSDPEPAPPRYAAADQMQHGASESESRSAAENMSQQLTAKNRLEQQKAAALAQGKMQAEQQKAKTVFAAKQPNRNRRAMTLAAIGLFSLALLIGIGYLYLQTASQDSGLLVRPLPIQNTPVSTPMNAPVSSVAAVAPEAVMPVSDTGSMQQRNAQPIGDLQSRAGVPERSGQTVKPATAPPVAPAPPASPVSTSQRPTSPIAAAAQSIQFSQSTVGSYINPGLANAYQFFISGDLASAQQQYQSVLQKDPNNHDALLGMAAIALNRNQTGQAGAFYSRLLELDPTDPDAIAGLTSLQGGDPSQSESRLKRILKQNPHAGAILFALGNLYAQQSRWSEAQQYYFRAFGEAPTNADYAFNLAVSLDRLDQEKSAMEFYQRALTLAQNKPITFNKSAVQDRIQALGSVAKSQ